MLYNIIIYLFSSSKYIALIVYQTYVSQLFTKFLLTCLPSAYSNSAMSSVSSSSSDVPIIDPSQMTRWRKLFDAFLDTKGCAGGLENKPTLSQSVLERLQTPDGGETERSQRYRSRVKTRIALWMKANRKAYGYLVRACKENESAMEIILDEANQGLTALELLQALDTRFSLGRIVGVVQAKLAAFNTMEITTGEKVENFINRILAARRELRELGCEYIDKDVFCLGRLKDALLRDPRFEATALSLQVNPHIKWEVAVRVLTALEANRCCQRNCSAAEAPIVEHARKNKEVRQKEKGK